MFRSLLLVVLGCATIQAADQYSLKQSNQEALNRALQTGPAQKNNWRSLLSADKPTFFAKACAIPLTEVQVPKDQHFSMHDFPTGGPVFDGKMTLPVPPAAVCGVNTQSVGLQK